MLFDNRGKIIGTHQPVGNMVGGAVVVCIDFFPAHAVSYCQSSSSLKQTGKPLDQSLRIREMRKSIVDNNTIEFLSDTKTVVPDNHAPA